MIHDDSNPLPATVPATLYRSVQFDLASGITGRTYRIFVFVPATDPPAEGFPLVVAVDGNMVFPILATVSATFQLTGKTAIAVGIGYPTSEPSELMRLRTRDLTPPTPLERIPQRPGLPPVDLADYGGADDFFRFLQEELLPTIAEAYPTDPADRTLYGHSWGGLFTLGVLFKHPEAFRNYVASSPSIWWNQRAVLADFPAFRTKIATGICAPRILISVGGTEQKVPTPLPAVMLEGVAKRVPYLPTTLQKIVAHLVVWKMLHNYAMVANAKALAARLKRLTGPGGYDAQVHLFDREDHLTALPASIGRAMDFVLRP
jgi:predicted alpha/beta superfamily hydrolase